MTACCDNACQLWKSSVCPCCSAASQVNHFLSGNKAAQIAKGFLFSFFFFLNLILVWSWLYLWIPPSTVRWTRWWLHFSDHSTNLPIEYRLGYSLQKVKIGLLSTSTGLNDLNQKSRSNGIWNTRWKGQVEEIMGALLPETWASQKVTENPWREWGLKSGLWSGRRGKIYRDILSWVNAPLL